MKKQRNKYRYFWNPLREYFSRIDNQGNFFYWLDSLKGWDNTVAFTDFYNSGILPNYEEVTLHQGLHYMKGNYVE